MHCPLEPDQTISASNLEYEPYKSMMLQIQNNPKLMARKLTLIQIVDNMDDRGSQVKYLLLQKKHVNMNTCLFTSAEARHKQSSKTALLPLKATKTQASQISSYKLHTQRLSY